MIELIIAVKLTPNFNRAFAEVELLPNPVANFCLERVGHSKFFLQPHACFRMFTGDVLYILNDVYRVHIQADMEEILGDMAMVKTFNSKKLWGVTDVSGNT